MTTRCSITIKEGKRRYRIYRHSDGYPEGVLSDLKILLSKSSRGAMLGFTDSEYLLANFIFYAKLSSYERYKGTRYFTQYGWECNYGVCSPDCEHGDLDYKYTIDADKGSIKIEKYNYDRKSFEVIFNDSLEKAFEKYTANGEFKNGCHISQLLLSIIEREVKALNELFEVEMKAEKANSEAELMNLHNKLNEVVIKNKLENTLYAMEIERLIRKKVMEITEKQV